MNGIILEFELEMTANSCTGRIITADPLANVNEYGLRSPQSRETNFSAEVLIEGYPIALDGIHPIFEDGVYKYEVNTDDITKRRWNSAMIQGEPMFIPQHITDRNRSRGGQNRRSGTTIERKRYCGLETTNQTFEGRAAITIEDEPLDQILAEFNRHIMVGTRIANIGSDPDLLDTSKVTMREDDGTYTVTTVNVYKGIGYQNNLFPTAVSIRKVGLWYFTRAEVVHRFDGNGKQIDVYGRLEKREDRQNYTREKGEF
jgi:hypothetical protein